MAFCNVISICTWNRFNSSLFRHFGKSRVSGWRTLHHQACCARFDSRQTSSVESCVVLSRHISTLNKNSLRFTCQGEQKGGLNINNCGLHCSKTCLQENVVRATQQTEQDLDTKMREDKEKAEIVYSLDENSSGEKARIQESLDDASLRSSCSELSERSTGDTETCSTEDSSSPSSTPLTAETVDKFLVNFFDDMQVKRAARENGLSNALFKRIFQEFKRKIILQVEDGNKEMLKLFSSSYYNANYMQQLFPLFMTYAQKVHPMLNSIAEVKKISDLRGPTDLFPEARAMKRKIIFHAGPTNSGKTHAAIQRFHAAYSGIYCGPLRLLATEVFRRTNNVGVPCDLLTGEDRQWAVSPDDPSNHISCTVEMCLMQRPFDCAVIDEIQMMRDTERGWAWSRALLGLLCAEIHVCGESSAINLVERLVSSCNDELEIRHYERLCPLEISQRSLDGNFKNIRAGDCVVAFSQWDLYQVRRQIERQTDKKCAIIYGSLPPATKLEQAMKFNDPTDECSVLVSSDAIGMGLNLNIRRIVFSSLRKFDGNSMAPLTSSQAKQIAGRAGRYGSAHSKGEVTTVSKYDSKSLKRLMKEPIEDVKAKWCELPERTVLVITSVKGAQMFETDGSIMIFWQALGESKEGVYSHFARGISAVGDKYICVGTSEGSIMVFDIPPRGTAVKLQETLASHKTAICELEAQGGRIVSSDEEGNIILWQSGGHFTEIIKIDGKGFPCSTVCLYKDFIIGGFATGHIRVFGASSGAQCIEACAHARWINAMDISVEAGLLVTASEDSCVRVWKLSDDSSPTMEMVFQQVIADTQLCGARFTDLSGDSFGVAGYDLGEIIMFSKK